MLRILLIVLAALPAVAADWEVGARHVMAMTSGENGPLEIDSSRGFGASAALFLNEHAAVQASVTLVNPSADYAGTDLGTLGMETYALTGRWYINPASRFSLFAGGGAALVKLGNLDDQFGEEIEVDFESETTFVAEAGVRYRFRPHLFVEAGAMYVPLEAESNVRRANVAFPEKVELNAKTVAVSASWRF